jgi:hypothetical protein
MQLSIDRQDSCAWCFFCRICHKSDGVYKETVFFVPVNVMTDLESDLIEGLDSVLTRVDSITDFGVVIDSRMSFSRHVTVGKALTMQAFALIRLETLNRIRSDAGMMFVFDVLSERVGLLNLLSLVNVIAPRYRTGGGDFMQIDFHCTNYGVHKPLSDAVRHFNEVAGLFDFHCGV